MLKETAQDKQADVQSLDLHNIFRLTSTLDTVEGYFYGFFGQNSVTQIRWNVLYTLMVNGGSMTPTALRERLLRSPHAITSVVDTLERDKAVRRERHPNDRRSVYIVLTKYGLSLIKEMIPLSEKMSYDLFSCFNPEEMQAFMGYLLRLKQHARQLCSNIESQNKA